MKTILTLLIIIVVGFFIYQGVKDETPSENGAPTEGSILGCYRIRSEKDVYTLSIFEQEESDVEGTLEFDNFEKDSSSGTFEGTYENEILLGDYAFQSEGTNSVIQVTFKKSGEDFIRGYGPLNTDGTRFTDLSKVTYDSSAPLSVFKKEACND